MTTWKNGNEPPELIAGSVTDERRRLLGLAYRLLGSVTDAEDVVQVAYARWYAMSPREQKEIQSPAAWLTTVASRICLDLLRSARVRRDIESVAVDGVGLCRLVRLGFDGEGRGSAPLVRGCGRR